MELFVNNSKIEVNKNKKIISKTLLIIIMATTQHNCSSHHCTHSSHDELDPPGQIQFSKEDYTSYLTARKEMKAEELRSARKAL